MRCVAMAHIVRLPCVSAIFLSGARRARAACLPPRSRPCSSRSWMCIVLRRSHRTGLDCSRVPQIFFEGEGGRACALADSGLCRAPCLPLHTAPLAFSPSFKKNQPCGLGLSEFGDPYLPHWLAPPQASVPPFPQKLWFLESSYRPRCMEGHAPTRPGCLSAAESVFNNLLVSADGGAVPVPASSPSPPSVAPLHFDSAQPRCGPGTH